MRILFFLISFKIILNQPYIYTPQYIIDFLNNLPISEELIQYFKDKLSKTFEDAYAFNEISKNPPNPSFSNNYYKKVNIQKVFNDINSKNSNIYKFYQDLKKVLFSLEDLHISLDLTSGYSILADTWFYQPLNLYIAIDNNEPRVFGVGNKASYWKNFRDYQNFII